MAMKGLTLQAIAAACGGKLYNGKDSQDKEISCAVMDSRKIESGGLFLASPGEKVDGHKFIGQVYEAGALCVVTMKTPDEVEKEHGIPQSIWGAYILVEDTFTALKQIAAFYRSKLTIPVVGITGSVGKTSTKEFIAGVLSAKYKVLKTEGNYNNEIGLPLTILRIRQEHEAAVLEMGISEFGEMSRLGEIAKPDICVITNIGQCHLENLHDRAGVFKAKTEIFDHMQPDGEICLNGEDDLLSMVSVVNGKPVHHFGLSEREDLEVFATDIENKGLQGSSVKMHIRNEEATRTVCPVEVALPGLHMINNAMAAALVGKLLGLSMEEIKEGITKVEPVCGRSNILKLSDKVVIDDCYNANPVSMKAALDLLSTAEGRKVAVLGDMFELGERSDAMHAEVGSYAADLKIDGIYCVGESAKLMYEAAEKKNHTGLDIRHFEKRDTLLEKLPTLLLPGDTVLVKASHGMGFAEVVEVLKSL